MYGILLVDKPKGWTSFDAVNYVRRIVAAAEGKKPRNCKVGHTGTLDPLATGLLVLLIGKEFTRRAPELSKLEKTYEAVIRLGQTSTTADAEGEKFPVSGRIPSLEEVQQVLAQFTGEIMQTPPIYSAMKVGGQRAYKLAREGKTVAMEARPAVIYRNELIEYAYPFIKFISRVGSGTYIRSLAEDIGGKLGTGAYLADLRRTSVGAFSLEDAVDVEACTASGMAGILRDLPPEAQA